MWFMAKESSLKANCGGHASGDVDGWLRIWGVAGGVLRPSDAGRLLGVSRQRVFELMDAGALLSVKWDGCKYVSLASVLRRLGVDKSASSQGGS